jgi:hypothetical protein
MWETADLSAPVEMTNQVNAPLDSRRDQDTAHRDLWNPTSDAKNASDMGHPGFVGKERFENKVLRL